MPLIKAIELPGNILSINDKGVMQKRWYIWYTKPRAEKKLLDRLLAKGIETFLPLRKELRQWSDRKKWVEVPLFNGYIFTHIDESEVDIVRFTEGILNFVRFEGKPAFLRQEQVDKIKFLITNVSDLEIEEEKYSFLPGDRVEVQFGPLSGFHGEVVSYRGNKRVAIRIEQLGKVILVELPKAILVR